MENIYGIVYKTTCLVNGKIYIGQTTCLNKKSYLGSGTLISAAIKKYGRENFIREILEKCFNQIDLDIYEELYIEQYDSINKKIGYNIAKGSVRGAIGEMSPTKLPEVRAKLSESKKNTSAETRAKMSEAKKGKNNHNYGKIPSKETRAKLSEYAKNRPEETRFKMSIPVLQYDKQGNFIAEYYAAIEAERQTGISASSIIKCCKGKLKSAKGYIWKYK